MVSLEDALAHGFSGVMLRGAGAPWDLRKSQPYECYAELDFDIPVGKNSDCYDRYLLRMEEMRQSVKIILQCCELLGHGKGAGQHRSGRTAMPSRRDMKQNMESLINHFKMHTEGFRVPEGEVYASR